MKPCLVDVNVWLALLVRHHDHHRAASAWYEGLTAGEAGLCRFAQLAIVRLLGTRAVVGDYAIGAGAAWDLTLELLADERVEFVAEPPDLDAVLAPLLRYPAPAPKLVADAYLAAVAAGSGRRVATFDRGFRQFRGLPVELLSRR